MAILFDIFIFDSPTKTYKRVILFVRLFPLPVLFLHFPYLYTFSIPSFCMCRKFFQTAYNFMYPFKTENVLNPVSDFFSNIVISIMPYYTMISTVFSPPESSLFKCFIFSSSLDLNFHLLLEESGLRFRILCFFSTLFVILYFNFLL